MSASKRKQAAAVSGTVEVPHYDVVALVLQCGGALGAYQAGVYEALHDAGIRPTGLAGISIEDTNVAVLAGSPQSQCTDERSVGNEGVGTCRSRWSHGN